MENKAVYPSNISHEGTFVSSFRKNTYKNEDLSGPSFLRTLYSGTQHNHETQLPKSSLRKQLTVQKIIVFILYAISCLAQLPIIIFVLVTKLDLLQRLLCLRNSPCSNRKKARLDLTNKYCMENILGLEVDEDFTEFWVPEDVYLPEEKYRYKTTLEEKIAKRIFSGDDIRTGLYKELNEIIRRNYINRMDVWKEVARKRQKDFTKCRSLTSGLALALLRGHSRMALSLLEYIQMNNTGETLANAHLNTRSDDLSLLHMGIMNCNFQFVEQFLNVFVPDDLYTTVNKSCSYAINQSMKSAELPLNLAVTMGECEIVKLLINNGAEMDQQDSQGFNPFHALVFLSLKTPEKTDLLFDTLCECIPIWIKKSKKYHELRLMTGRNARKMALWRLLKTVDQRRYTPLKLAVAEGMVSLVKKIFTVTDVYHFPYRNLGPNSLSLYDVSEVDPYLTHFSWGKERASVLELVVLLVSNEQLPLLEVAPISTIALIKKKTYDSIFMIWGSLHGLVMIIVTSYHLHVPQVEVLNDPSTNQTMYHRRPTSNDINVPDILIFMLVVMYSFYAVAILFIAQCAGRRCAKSFNFSFIMWTLNRVHCSTLVIFVVFASVYMVLKHQNSEYVHIFLAITVAVGWLQSLLFLRGLDQTAFFSVMLYNIGSGDVVRFGLIILAAILMFAVTTIIFFSPYVTDTDSVHVWHKAMLSYLRLAMGITDFPILYKSTSKFDFIPKLIYVMFLIALNLVILNMLIATMTDTYSRVKSHKKLLCLKAQTGDCIFLEWLLPIFIQKQLAVPVKKRLIRIKLPDSSMWENNVYLVEAPSPN